MTRIEIEIELNHLEDAEEVLSMIKERLADDYTEGRERKPELSYRFRVYSNEP